MLLAGHGLTVMAVLGLRAMDGHRARRVVAAWLAAVPLALLGAGLGAARAAALRAASLSGALFGLTMCFQGCCAAT